MNHLYVLRLRKINTHFFLDNNKLYKKTEAQFCHKFKNKSKAILSQVHRNPISQLDQLYMW